MSKETVAPFGAEPSGDVEQQVGLIMAEMYERTYSFNHVGSFCFEILLTKWIWNHSYTAPFVVVTTESPLKGIKSIKRR